jgi:uncharacterized membrane protein
MLMTKNRLETFSDGVIAIIITIMVLNIPLPDKFGFNDIMHLLGSILIFFVSFFIVGSQWNNHHILFARMQEVTNKIIWRNFLYLFFLSLMPIFTKWVIQHPDENVPAIAYDILFILVNVSYHLIRNCAIQDDGYKDFRKEMERIKEEGKASIRHFIIMIIVMIGIVVLSLFYPRVSLIFFIAVPVVTSLLNLIFDNRKEIEKRRIAK